MLMVFIVVGVTIDGATETCGGWGSGGGGDAAKG